MKMQAPMTKSHNSVLLYDQIMPLFGLRKFWLKFCMYVAISETSTDNSSKLHVHVWDENGSFWPSPITLYCFMTKLCPFLDLENLC